MRYNRMVMLGGVEKGMGWWWYGLYGTGTLVEIYSRAHATRLVELRVLLTALL